MMSLSDILTAGEHVTVAGISFLLWWLERGERLKLARRLDKCLEERARDHHGKRGQ